MARDETAREQVDRRTYLKLTGVGAFSAAATAIGTDDAAATTAGYGEGGYGGTAYGGSDGSGGEGTDTNPSVSASGATGVAQTAAQLNGTLSALGGAASANVHFEYRPVGASSWITTTAQTLSSTTSFSTRISGLQVATDYEYRAVASASDGDTATSSTATFATARHSLVIDGSPHPTTTNMYSFSVSGSVEKSSHLGSIQRNDTISGRSVDGEVVGGKDGFRFTGDVTDFHVDGNPAVYLDGAQVGPAELGDTTYPHTLIIDGSAAPRRKATYEATVSGKLTKSSVLGSIQSNDTIAGSTATGQVYGGTDGYRFTGELTELRVDGKLTISLTDGDGSSSASDSLPNSMVVDGTGTPNRTATYAITVDGSVEKSAQLGSINAFDSVSDGTVSGRVVNGKDGYRYAGEVTKVQIDGPAVLRFEDTDS